MQLFCIPEHVTFFDSHNRDSRGLSAADGSSVLLKFENIIQLQNIFKLLT